MQQTSLLTQLSLDKPVFLAPMEDVSDQPFRILCKRHGADAVVTEFVNSDGIIRGCRRADKKMRFSQEERPIGIQIYGHLQESMLEAAKRVEEFEPDFIDINAGCWVKKVANRGAGAGFLKDPARLEAVVQSITDAVSIPVTVKTRIGWDQESINISDVAKRVENGGACLLTVHGRTRSQGHSGPVSHLWLDEVRRSVSIPIIANGDITDPFIAEQLITENKFDGIMIGRAAIGNPWIFAQCRQLIQHNQQPRPIELSKRADVCLEHLLLHIENKGEERGIPSFRKFYSGYFKGLRGAAQLRSELVRLDSFACIKEKILDYAEKTQNTDVRKPEMT